MLGRGFPVPFRREGELGAQNPSSDSEVSRPFKSQHSCFQWETSFLLLKSWFLSLEKKSTDKNLFQKLIVKIQFSSVAQLCPTLCEPLACSTPGFPVHHQLPELAQTHIHGVGDAIQPSHPLLSSSPPAFNLSQHEGLFHDSLLRIR